MSVLASQSDRFLVLGRPGGYLMRRAAALVALLLALLAPDVAGAARIGISDARALLTPAQKAQRDQRAAMRTEPGLEADLEAARDYWGVRRPPRCRLLNYYYAPMPPGVWGLATMPLPGSAPVICHMRVKPGLTPWHQCAVVVHEYGHWLGLGHDPNETSPMFSGWSPHLILPQCDDRSKQL